MEGKAVPKATILGFTEKQRDNSSKHEKIKTWKPKTKSQEH